MESQIKISLKNPGPCRIPTNGPRGRGSAPPPWVSAGNIKSGVELSLNTVLHFSMRTHGQTPILRLAMERKDGYNRPVVQSLDCCAEWDHHSYRAAGCASTLRPAAVYVSMPIFTPIACGIARGFSAPLKPPPPSLRPAGAACCVLVSLFRRLGHRPGVQHVHQSAVVHPPDTGGLLSGQSSRRITHHQLIRFKGQIGATENIPP